MKLIQMGEMQKKRFQFLYRLYQLSGGDEFSLVDMYQIGRGLGFDRKLTEKIVWHLHQEGLIGEMTAYGGGIGISHQGIYEVEEALSKPNKPTHHFPALNIISIGSIGQMIGSPIQQASPGVEQVITINEHKYEELQKVMQSLRGFIDNLGLSLQQKSDLKAEIQTIEGQMTSSKPKSLVMTQCLDSIRNILEGAAGNVLASVLLSKIGSLIGG
jgi:hypothetical protein